VRIFRSIASIAVRPLIYLAAKPRQAMRYRGLPIWRRG
jgi:hypothetical protein